MAEYNNEVRMDGSCLAKLKVETEQGRTKVFIDGHDCSRQICSFSLDWEPGEIPLARIDLATINILTNGNTAIYFEHTKEMAKALMKIMPEISAYRAMELAQKLMYRLATGPEEGNED